MNAYEKVEALRKKYPNEPVKALAKRAEVTTSTYYAHRKSAGKLTKKPKANYKKISLPEPTGQRLMVIMGSPEQIREVLQ